MKSATDPEIYKREMIDELIRRYGFVISGKELYGLLGFSNAEGYRQARLRGLLPIRTFQFPGRRAHFALASDVAECLCAQRFRAASPSKPGI